ncbi:hypothetical protein YC2023_066024 [Brassica napus]
MSVPVVSWQFDARGKLPKEPFPVCPPADTRRSALATLAAQAACQQSTGCSPWRPDGVMSPTGRERHSVLQIFKGCRECTGHHVTCGALPAAGPYLRLSRFQGGQAVSAQLGTITRLPVHAASPVLLTKNGPLGALDSVGWLNKAATLSYLFKSFAPIPKSDKRFARQYRCGPPPEFPLASPRSGIVHHLSGPDMHAHTRTLLRRSRSIGCAPMRDPANQLPCTLRVYSPVDSHTCQTPRSVFQDGSNGEPTGRHPSTQMPRHAVRRVLQTTIKAATSPRAFFSNSTCKSQSACCACSLIQSHDCHQLLAAFFLGGKGQLLAAGSNETAHHLSPLSLALCFVKPSPEVTS